MGWLRDSSLRATRLADFEQRLVAAPAYIERAGRPRTPEALAEHDWIALSLLGAPLTWQFSGPDGAQQTVRMKSRLKVDSAAALRALLESGAGISVLDQRSAWSARSISSSRCGRTRSPRARCRRACAWLIG